MEYLKSIFDENFVEDSRVAALSFELLNYHVDFLPPNPYFFLQIILIIAFQMVIGCLLGVLIYYGIVLQSTKEGEGTTQGYLLGYGLVIPFSVWLPFWAVAWIDIRSVGFRLGLAALPSTVVLRCLEAMYGFVPKSSRSSLWTYILSIGFILRPRYDMDGSVIPLTPKIFGSIMARHLQWLLGFAVLVQLFSPSNYFPFPTAVKADEVWLSFDVCHLYNTFVQATMMNVTLAFSMSGIGAIASLLAGIQFDDRITDMPMFLSTSPSDFWGRRWNNVIHVGLKQGVYKPVRWNTGSRTLASIAAFVVSGIYHEYVWMLIFHGNHAQVAEGMHEHDNTCCISCHCNAWIGKQMLFFCWNGVLVAIEYFVGDQIAPCMKQFLPRWLRSHLIVLLSLPVGHLFTADMTHAGYFTSIQQALPIFAATRIAYE